MRHFTLPLLKLPQSTLRQFLCHGKIDIIDIFVHCWPAYITWPSKVFTIIHGVTNVHSHKVLAVNSLARHRYVRDVSGERSRRGKHARGCMLPVWRTCYYVFTAEVNHGRANGISLHICLEQNLNYNFIFNNDKWIVFDIFWNSSCSEGIKFVCVVLKGIAEVLRNNSF